MKRMPKGPETGLLDFLMPAPRLGSCPHEPRHSGFKEQTGFLLFKKA